MGTSSTALPGTDAGLSPNTGISSLRPSVTGWVPPRNASTIAWISAGSARLKCAGVCCARSAGVAKAMPTPRAVASSRRRRVLKRLAGISEKVIKTALDPCKIFCDEVGGANIHVDLSLQHPARAVDFILEHNRDLFLRVCVDHHVAEVVRQYRYDFLACHTFSDVLRHNFANGVRDMGAFWIVSELVGNGAHGVAHHVHVVIVPGSKEPGVNIGPACGLAIGSLANQAGIPNDIGGLMRRHQDRVIEIEVTCGCFYALVERIDFFHTGIWDMGDDVRIQLLERRTITLSDRRDLGLGIENNDLARDVVGFEMPRNQASTLVRRRRASMRWWRQCHDNRTAFETPEFALEGKHFSVGDIRVREVPAGVFGGIFVVAEPGLVCV